MREVLWEEALRVVICERLWSGEGCSVWDSLGGCGGSDACQLIEQ